MLLVDGGAWANDSQLDVTSKAVVRLGAENESLRTNAGSAEATHLTVVGIVCFLVGVVAGAVAVVFAPKK
jgi:hypothetical protein